MVVFTRCLLLIISSLAQITYGEIASEIVSDTEIASEIVSDTGKSTALATQGACANVSLEIQNDLKNSKPAYVVFGMRSYNDIDRFASKLQGFKNCMNKEIRSHSDEMKKIKTSIQLLPNVEKILGFTNRYCKGHMCQVGVNSLMGDYQSVLYASERLWKTYLKTALRAIKIHYVAGQRFKTGDVKQAFGWLGKTKRFIDKINKLVVAKRPKLSALQKGFNSMVTSIPTSQKSGHAKRAMKAATKTLEFVSSFINGGPWLKLIESVYKRPIIKDNKQFKKQLLENGFNWIGIAKIINLIIRDLEAAKRDVNKAFLNVNGLKVDIATFSQYIDETMKAIGYVLPTLPPTIATTTLAPVIKECWAVGLKRGDKAANKSCHDICNGLTGNCFPRQSCLCKGEPKPKKICWAIGEFKGEWEDYCRKMCVDFCDRKKCKCEGDKKTTVKPTPPPGKWCPEGQPYVFNHGNSCCSLPMERKKCNFWGKCKRGCRGDQLRFQSTCCTGSIVKCKIPPCKNNFDQ